MSNSTGSKELPEDVQEWIKETAKEICKKTKLHSEPDIIIEHGDYSIAGLLVCKEIAERLFFKLQEDKPKGMRWVPVSEGLPDRRPEPYCVIYGKGSRGTLHVDYFSKEFKVTHWLDESSDDVSAFRSENERLKGERDEYRILLEELSESARASDMPSVANGIDVILDKYPKPTT